MVFGTPLRPLPGAFGPGLSWRLSGRVGRSKVVESAIVYLRSALADTLAPLSLGWGLLGLRAWDAEPPEASSWLALAFEKAATREVRTAELAMLLLAAGSRSLEILGIPASDPNPIIPEAAHHA